MIRGLHKKCLRNVVMILLLFCFSMNVFAATTSGNDGSAFITKAEFDSLKNNFQSQIDVYNQGIDSKIDTAIASYLSGINIERKRDISSVYAVDYHYIESFGTDNPIPADRLKGSFTWKGLAGASCMNGKKYNTDTRTGYLYNEWNPVAKRYGKYTVAKMNDDGKYWNPVTYEQALVGELEYIMLICGYNGRFYNSGPAAVFMPMWYIDGKCTGTQRDTLVNFYDASHGTNCERGEGWPATDTGKSDDWCFYYIDTSTKPYTLKINNHYSVTKGYKSNWNWCSVFTPRATDENVQTYNMGANTPTSLANNLKWEDKASNTKTLTSFFASEYKTPFAVFPKDVENRNWVRATPGKSVTKTDLFSRYEITWNRGMWHQDANYSSTNLKWIEDDATGTDDRTPSTWTLNTKSTGTDDYSVFPSPTDLSYMSILFDSSKDRKNQFYYDVDVLKENDTNLVNLMKANGIGKGVPLFKIEEAGTLEFSMPFIDTTKEYDCWFLKGPLSGTTDVRSATYPNNAYQVTGSRPVPGSTTTTPISQNTNKSITIKATDKVVFEVEKDQYVYCIWAEKNKKGGGKIALPINGTFTIEQ